MFQPEIYLEDFTRRLKEAFGPRLRYVGLQGSYLRGEAREGSDIDVMAVIDGLSAADLAVYRQAVQSMERPELACGFVCGTEELARWNRLELCHLVHATGDFYGRLADLLPPCDREDVRQFVKLSLNNLYHELGHRRIHAGEARSAEALPGSWRQVFFILQNAVWLETGRFPATKARLLSQLEGKDRAVMERLCAMEAGEPFDFEESFALLFDWCRWKLGSV